MDAWTDTCEFFKATADPAAIIHLVNNRPLQSLIASWPYVKISKTGGGDAVTGGGDRWDWLWENVLVDMADLAHKAGIDRPARVFQQARGARLIFPDGSVLPAARAWITALAMKKVELRRPKGDDSESKARVGP